MNIYDAAEAIYNYIGIQSPKTFTFEAGFGTLSQN